MFDSSALPPGPEAHTPRQQVLDMVTARVRDAELAEAGQAGAPGGRGRHRRLDPTKVSARELRTPEQRREARALRRVFTHLGECYRDYRTRTGAAVSPEVRAAASRFRRERDFTSLVFVAASLDRLEFLNW